MQTTIQFLNSVFWFSILLILTNSYNFVKILLISEIVWVIVYTYSVYIASIIDNAELLSFSLIILGIAGLEYSIGLVITLSYKNLYNSVIFSDNIKK